MSKLKNIMEDAKKKERKVTVEDYRKAQEEFDLLESAGETVVDVAKTVPQALTLNWADEILEMFGFPEAGEKTKEMAQEARERSPIASFATDVAMPIGGGAKIGKSVLKGAMYGGLAGAGMGEEPAERAIYGAGGAGLGAGGTFIGNLLSKVAGKPAPTRAGALGASKSSQKILKGPKSVQESVQLLNKTGFLKKGNRVFDPKSGKFVKGGKLKVEDGPEFLYSLRDRAVEAENIIDAEVREILKTNKLKIMGDEVEEYIPLLESLDGVERKLGASVGQEKAAKIVSEELDKLKNYIDERAVQFDLDGNPIYGEGAKRGKTFLELDKDVKAIWQQMSDDVLEAEAKMGGVLAPDVKARGQVQREIAKNLRKFIIDKMGGESGKKIADLNAISSSLKTARKQAIEEGIASQAAQGFRTDAPIGTNMAYFGGRVAESMGATPEAGLSRASLGEAVEMIPKGVRRFTEESVKRYPVREGQRFMQSAEGSPALMGLDALLGGDEGRSPQSVGMPIEAKVNFMLADTEIPRSTEWVKEHPNLFVGRLMQVAPELAAQVQIALDKGQDRVLQKTLPLIAQQVPEIFEHDEYNSFDGKILDPAMKGLYIEKVQSDPNLSNYERAEIIDHLNKTNEVLE